MAARAANNDFESATPQGFSHDRIRARPVNDYGGANRVFPLRVEEDVAHAPEIALSFFANVTDEQQRQFRGDLEFLTSCRDGQQRSGSSGIVRNPRAVEPRPLLADLERASGRKNRIQMSAD